MDAEKKEKCFGGNWTFTKLLGAGSYGQVYAAERVDFGKTYSAAIKVITIPHSRSEIDSVYSEGMTTGEVTEYFRKYVEQLVEEFEIMSSLKGCSNIVNYEDHEVIAHEDGIGWDIYIRMELLTPLTKKIPMGMTMRDVLRLGIDICKALELCRVRSLIHRDIKPENIFVSEFGDYKLGDFGIARTLNGTSGGLSRKGTYSYMAPEVYLEKPYGAAIDIYSLGIVLYRLLNANRTPFLPPYPKSITHSDRENAIQKQMKGLEPLPAPARADEALAKIILRACAYEPEARYQSPAEMRQALEALQAQYSAAQLDLIVLEPMASEGPAQETQAIIHSRSTSSQTLAETVVQPKAPTAKPVAAPTAPKADGGQEKKASAAEKTPPLPKKNKPAPSGEGTPKEKIPSKKNPLLYGGIAIGIGVVVLLIVLLAGSGKKQDKKPHDDGGAGNTYSAGTTEAPSAETTDTPVGNWTEEFPEEAFLSGAQIETELQYRSSALLLHDTEDASFGDLCYAQEAVPGKWSEWQTEEITATDTLEVEKKTVYFSRRLVKRQKSNDFHTATWTEYGWSGWSECDENVKAVRGSVEVRSETQYRSRPLENRYFYAENWSEWDTALPNPDENTVVQVRQSYRVTEEKATPGEISMANFGVNGAVQSVFSDVPDGKWYTDTVRAVADAGILTPNAFLRFEPDENVKVGEVIYAADMISRCYNGEAMVQITDETLYPVFLRDAVQRGIVEENEIKSLDVPATRSQVAAILYHALPDEVFGKVNNVHSITDMVEGTEAYACVKRLAEAGVFTWQSPDGAFSPESGMTGAQLASAIYRVIYPADTAA